VSNFDGVVDIWDQGVDMFRILLNMDMVSIPDIKREFISLYGEFYEMEHGYSLTGDAYIGYIEFLEGRGYIYVRR